MPRLVSHKAMYRQAWPPRRCCSRGVQDTGLATTATTRANFASSFQLGTVSIKAYMADSIQLPCWQTWFVMISQNVNISTYDRACERRPGPPQHHWEALFGHVALWTGNQKQAQVWRGPFFLSHALHLGIRELHWRPVQVPCFCSACFSQCRSRRRLSADAAASSSLHLTLHRSCIGQP